jgi:FAD/FMN-containing dehydrogenase
MMDIRATLRARLDAAVGSDQVLTAAPDLAPYVTDWRGRYHGRAMAVVRPGDTEQVSSVVRACADLGVPMVPQGGNTGQCGGATPDERGNAIVLSLSRMNRVRAIDPANATLTAEAGVPLALVQDAAAKEGLMFPLSLAAEGSCTIGGNLSTNAGGHAVLRFGNARDLVLGIEVVLADGRIWNGLRALRKDNTGYDLKHLFIGAEGTLGIITAAVLKLYPAPRGQGTALAAVTDVATAIRLLSNLKQELGDRITGFELMSACSLALSRKYHPALPDPCPGSPWYTLIQVDDNAPDSDVSAQLERALQGALESAIVTDATIAQSSDQARALWALRENIAEAQRRDGPNIKHDISVPVSAMAHFLDDAARELEAALPGLRFVTFGHLGDGNLHYNLAAPEGIEPESFLANTALVNRIVYDLVAAHGGSVSAEHGIGKQMREELLRYKCMVEVDLMRAVKSALDPAGLFNPGKIFRAAP